MKGKTGLLILLLLGCLLLGHARATIPIQQSYWGMEYACSGARANFYLQTNTTMYASRWTSQYDTNISTISLILWAFNSPVYRFSLQYLDGSGNPDRNCLSYIDFTATGGEQIKTFDIPDFNISRGIAFAVVIEYVSGTIGGSNYANIYAQVGSAMNKKFYAGGIGYSDEIADIRGSGNNRTSWSRYMYVPEFLTFNMVSGEKYGQIYQTSASATVTTGNVLGENFTVPYNMTISGVQMWISMTTSSAAELNVSIYDSTTASYVVDHEHFVNKSDISTDKPTHFLNNTVDLTAGHSYILFLSSIGGSYPMYYMMCQNSATYYPQTFQNTTALLLGGASGIPNTPYPRYDTFFRFIVVTETAPAAGGGDLTEPGDLALLIVIGLICVPVGIILLAVVFRRRH
jgi:hypothetical protein